MTTTARELRREELAWAAGFFDGEGNCQVTRKGNTVSGHLRLAQGFEGDWYLGRFREAVGGLGSVSGPHARPNPRHTPHWRYAACGYEKIQAIDCMLWPYLGPVKKAQIAFCLSEMARGQRRKTWMHYTDDQKAIRAAQRQAAKSADNRLRRQRQKASQAGG